MEIIKRILDINVLNTTKKIIRPSFKLYKESQSNYGFFFHIFLKEEFTKLVNLNSYKKLYLMKDKTAFLEFEDCLIEIPPLTPALEKYIRESSPTLIFFSTRKGQTQLFGALSP